MTRSNLSPEKQLHLIQSTISQAKENLRKHSFPFLFWGWLVSISALINFLLLWVVDAEDNALLEQISKRQAVRFNPGSTQTRSLPRFWYVEGGSLYLVPTPTSARNYTHVYVATEPTLSLDADEPDIPDYAIDLVVIKAAIMVSARTDNTSLQMLLQQEEKDLLDSFYDEARRSRGSVVPQTRRDWHVG